MWKVDHSGVSSQEEWLGLAGEGRTAAVLLTGIAVCSVPARSCGRMV